jgi:serine/threonine protein kinase
MGGNGSPENWSRLAGLIDTLLDTAPERRTALIDELSGGDPRRRMELERLLAECEHESPLLNRSAPDLFAALFENDAVQFPAALAERYKVEKELGRGGMATVYLARDVKHRRDVAVKVVHPGMTSVLGADRFLGEIQIVAQLQHPHIVPLYDSGEADGSLYYVMPYEGGLSLRDRLVRDGPLPSHDVVLILRDVCDALVYAHERGIVHLDIKPDNVLLSGHHAMVADFGVAKAVTDSATGSPRSVSAIALGTPAYMAPEQIEARPDIDRRADIYSVGVLAYELLTGAPPFVGETRREIIDRHLKDAPVSIDKLRPEVPEPLARLVMKCLEKRPEDRWQSVEEIARQLETIGIDNRGSTSIDSRRRRWMFAAAGVGLVVVGIAVAAFAAKRGDVEASWQNRWNSARIERLTDFPGSEVDAAISPDGKLLTFLADRDSVFDAFVGRVGSGQFLNLTNGRFPQLLNEDVRNVGFTGDASHVWIRVADIASPASVSLIPTAGGPAAPFLKTAVMAVWSPDRKTIAYHETTPRDPIFVADTGGRNQKRIFISDPGIHNHYLSWSPDGAFIYFSRGIPPDRMDIWRIPWRGGRAEKITNQNSTVAYPVLLDARTLLYIATADDGTGPWLYSMDLNDHVASRVTKGVEHYISISASDDLPGQPRRLVAAVSNPIVQLWSVPIIDGIAEESAATRVSVPTARAAAPRFAANGDIWYLASRGGADGLWRLAERRDAGGRPDGKGGTASEIWTSARGAVMGAAALSPDGARVCFLLRHDGRSRLNCASLDGTDAHALADSLDVRGSGSWSADGKWIAAAVDEAKGARLFKIPMDGGSPIRLVDSASSNPVWSPDGKFILYSGTPHGRSAPLRAVTPGGKPFPIPPLVVDRDGDSYRFVPGRNWLVVKQGGFRRQDFWLVDLTTGKRRQLTRLRPGESLQRFDVSPDGKRIVFERVRENSDIALIELPPR